MAGIFKAPRFRQVLAVMVAAGALTLGLRLGGLLGTAGQVTAYATALLAVGTLGLAAGIIGLYAEQRRANQQQEGQLIRRRVADLAQVEIERFSGPGEMVRINVRNGTDRSITNVYVWADVRGVHGHYAAGVPAGDAQSRRMANVPHGEGFYWQLRVIRPGRQAFFTQLTHMNPRPVAAAADADITAFAEFTDVDGDWWRCDEDGNLSRQQPSEQPGAQLPGGPGHGLPPEIPALEAPPSPALRGRPEAWRDAAWLTRFGGRVTPRSAPQHGAGKYSAVP